MRSIIIALGLIISATACEVDDVDDADFRNAEEDADAEAPQVAVLYDNCAPLSGCGGTTCNAGGCWYQPQGSIWKIPNTDMDCFHGLNDTCRCDIAQKAAVDAQLTAAGWTLTDEGAEWIAGDETCQPADVPDVEPL